MANPRGRQYGSSLDPYRSYLIEQWQKTENEKLQYVED